MEIYEKIKNRRKELGLTDVEVSKRIGFQEFSEYMDVEFNDNEITDVWAIKNVKVLCRILKFDYFDLFDSKCAFCENDEIYLEEYKLPRNELLIKKRMDLGLSQMDLGDKVGWDIGPLEKSDREFDESPIMEMTDIINKIKVPIQILYGAKCKKCGR
jgi:transcriptional regulator with XRE-family HTH domain